MPHNSSRMDNHPRRSCCRLRPRVRLHKIHCRNLHARHKDSRSHLLEALHFFGSFRYAGPISLLGGKFGKFAYGRFGLFRSLGSDPRGLNEITNHGFSGFFLRGVPHGFFRSSVIKRRGVGRTAHTEKQTNTQE